MAKSTSVKQLHDLPLIQISVSKSNPRKQFDDSDLIELAASISKFGVMQPVIVRPVADMYELVCGERRFRGSQLAGMQTIPAIIRELTDDEAFDLAITENLQRKDINVMEESDAFYQLTKRGKTTAKQIGDRFGKSEKYVYDRLALQNCIEGIKKLLRDNVITITHAKQFAKLGQADQEALLETCIGKKDGIQLSELKRIINDKFTLKLIDAPFDINDAKLLKEAGSCHKCPKRSGCNKLLFDDIDAIDICFDKSCYDKKVGVYVDILVKQLEDEGKRVFKISAFGNSNDDAVLGYMEYNVLENAPDGHNTVGVVVLSAPWNSLKVGMVKNIEVVSDDANDNTEDNESNDDDINSTSITPVAKSHAEKQQQIDHQDEFSKQLVIPILDKFKQDYAAVSNSLLIRDKIVSEFWNLRNEILDIVINKLEWEVIKDEKGNVDYRKTIEKAYDSTQYGAGYFYDLVLILHKADWSWDTDVVEELKDYFSAIGIDLSAMMDQYEAEHNHKF